jgi:hypothetical protein
LKKKFLKRKGWARINLEIGCLMSFWGSQGINLSRFKGNFVGSQIGRDSELFEKKFLQKDGE